MLNCFDYYIYVRLFPANTRRRLNVGLMLVRRRTNINTTLGQRRVFAGLLLPASNGTEGSSPNTSYWRIINNTSILFEVHKIQWN